MGSTCRPAPCTFRETSGVACTVCSMTSSCWWSGGMFSAHFHGLARLQEKDFPVVLRGISWDGRDWLLWVHVISIVMLQQ